MDATNRISWALVARQALAGGIAGGVAIYAYLWLTTVLPAHGGMVAAFQLAPVSPLLGVVVHFVVAIAWAAGYAYFAASQPATNRHWYVAGPAYGIVVYMMMQLIDLAGGTFHGPSTPNAFVNACIAHIVFYGIPVAYVVRATSRA